MRSLYASGLVMEPILLRITYDKPKYSNLFELTWKGSELGTFTTPLPGLYNIYNILSAVATYLIRRKTRSDTKVLDGFTGVGRRFEIVGEPMVQ